MQFLLQLLNLVTAVYKQAVAKRMYLCSNKILLMGIEIWISCRFSWNKTLFFSDFFQV